MAIKSLVALLVGLTLAAVRFAEAQQPTKVYKIGFLGPGSDQSYSRFQANTSRVAQTWVC